MVNATLVGREERAFWRSKVTIGTRWYQSQHRRYRIWSNTALVSLRARACGSSKVVLRTRGCQSRHTRPQGRNNSRITVDLSYKSCGIILNTYTLPSPPSRYRGSPRVPPLPQSVRPVSKLPSTPACPFPRYPPVLRWAIGSFMIISSLIFLFYSVFPTVQSVRLWGRTGRTMARSPSFLGC